MTSLRATLCLVIILTGTAAFAAERRDSPLELLSNSARYSLSGDTGSFTNGGEIRWGGIVLTAHAGSFDRRTGWVLTEGNVRLQRGDEVWTGNQLRYNYVTGEMVTDEFRTGKPPVFASGSGLHGFLASQSSGTNSALFATNALITSDDVSHPAVSIRARHIKILAGERIEARDATLCIGDVPVFYFPYFARNLGPRANNLSFTPGYRSRFGPFVLGTYTWFLNDHLDGELHLDYRQKRGFGGGPDVNFDFGPWGAGTLGYYFAHDDNPRTNFLNSPVLENRQRLHFSYQANPSDDLNIKSLVRYQNDAGVVRDFFEREYRNDPQPNTFVEVNRFWSNFSVDLLAQPRLNDFFETVERLPDVRISGFRQQIGRTPFYYESETSAGYYRRLFAETNLAPPGLNYEAARADTYHQVTLPQTWFGWLNVVPRAGGRFTYYGESSGPAGIYDEELRRVFNTGAEVSFKASRLWPAVRCETFELTGVRHIVEPSANYVYVPRPNVRPSQLPRFDYELPSLRMLPIDFPDYNAIDSVDSQNVIRFGLRNRLQTKRDGMVEDFLDWQLYADWRLRPRADQDQRTYGDLYSDLTFRPRSWLTLQSQTRFDPNEEELRMSLHTLTLQPNNVWSFSLGHFYLRDDFSASPTALGEGNNLITSSLFYRVNENWGFRATHHVDVRDGRLQEQYYTVYRDLRSWTAALSLGRRDNGIESAEYLVSFTFSIKALPRYRLGSDSVRPYSLLGSR